MVTVDVQAGGANLRLAISDDGIGGADPHKGSGLVGCVAREQLWKCQKQIRRSIDDC